MLKSCTITSLPPLLRSLTQPNPTPLFTNQLRHGIPTPLSPVLSPTSLIPLWTSPPRWMIFITCLALRLHHLPCQPRRPYSRPQHSTSLHFFNFWPILTINPHITFLASQPTHSCFVVLVVGPSTHSMAGPSLHSHLVSSVTVLMLFAVRT